MAVRRVCYLRRTSSLAGANISGNWDLSCPVFCSVIVDVGHEVTVVGEALDAAFFVPTSR
jgi:hypothetical protein